MRRTTTAIAVLLGLLASLVTTAAVAGTTAPITAADKPATPKAQGEPSKRGTANPKSFKRVRVLGINDFHGNLEPPTGSSGTIPTGTTGPNGTGAVTTTSAGGANYLATHVKRLSAGRESVLVGAGDLIGATPLISGIFHDEPTIDVLNEMGMEFAGVGNHEFDEGAEELLRMQFGGCHPTDTQNTCIGGPFMGAAFKYLAANVRYDGTDETLLPPYKIKRAGGVPVAYIGLTLKETPSVVTPAGVEGLTFDEEAATINRLVAELSAKRGVEAFVIAVHQGGQQNRPFSGGFPDANKCENPTGDIFNIVPRLSSKVDVVLSAHTHQQYICEQAGKLVTSAAAFGRLITTVDMTLDPKTKDVVTRTARNEIVTRDVPEDAGVKAIVDKYKAASAPRANRIVGATTGLISRTANPAGESPLGDVIADAQLAATDGPDQGAAVVAFMNPGGIRADLNADGSPFGNQVSYEELFNVQPFNNTLRTKTLTGAQLDTLLEQQFGPGGNATRNQILQVSNGFTYTYSPALPIGQRVDPASIKINGVTVSPTTGYRVTMNEFLATGGDNFPAFRDGTNETFAPGFDIDALEAYVAANSPVAPGPQNRITRAP